MSIYKPSELQAFLRELGVSPKKVLSQNFLIDGNVVKNILKSASVQPRELVLEIGPGPGALTEELLIQGAHVIAVEKDDQLAAALKRFHSHAEFSDRLHIFCDDIMKFPIEETVCSLLKPNQRAKVIANLPYHLTSIIIEKLIQMNDLFSSLTLMVQEEVARRFVAKPKTKEYSSFTLFLNFYGDVEYSFKVKRSCFYPVPKVDSAIINIVPKSFEDPSLDIERFFELTRTAFKHRRKMLRASLKELYSADAVSEALQEIGCPVTTRPEELSKEQFIVFFKILNI